MRLASASFAPLLIARWYTSSRCWASSSTISASFGGDRFSPRSRSPISRFQSGMFESADAIDGFDKLAPTVPLCFEDLPTLSGQTIVTAPSLPGLLHPTALNPTALFEPVEQRVKRG